MQSTRLLLAFIVLLPAASFSQKYHTPAEILKILTDSKMTYEMGALDVPEVEVIEAPVELNHGLFLKASPGGGLLIRSFGQEYGSNHDYVENLQEAEKAFVNDSLNQARAAYLRVLLVAPNQSQVMTYLGQTYEHEKVYASASDWYHKAIDANFFDYAAHWFLADALDATWHHEEAVKEILLARVLNRTNSRVSESLDRILKGSHRSYSDWRFHPQYEVKSLGSNKVSVKYDRRHPEWLAYALCKAVWQFEPGYKESMLKETKEHPMMVEEKECLINVLIGLQNADRGTKDEALQVAQKSLDDKSIFEYIVYEIILPLHPEFAFNIARPLFESISEYILKYRTQPL